MDYDQRNVLSFSNIGLVNIILIGGNKSLIYHFAVLFELYPDIISIYIDFFDIQGVTLFKHKGRT